MHYIWLNIYWGKNMNKDIAIIVATHKQYWMPEDDIYLPVFVGAIGKDSPVSDWQRDDSGENISEKNKNFCELTGHYWLWKNISAEAYGLCHYRRYFIKGLSIGDKRKRIATGRKLKKLLSEYDVILPKKRHYWIETNYTQYVHAHHEEELLLTRKIITERCSDFLPCWDRVMRRCSGHRFNMFVMKRPLFEAYSIWLFDLLFELEKRLDISSYSTYDQRVFGFVAERLLDVWIDHERPCVAECRMGNLERELWCRKIVAFLKRKLKGRRR